VQGYTLLSQLSAVSVNLSKDEIKLNLEIIKFLLEHGADRTLKSVGDFTAYDLAEAHVGKVLIQDMLKHVKQIFKY